MALRSASIYAVTTSWSEEEKEHLLEALKAYGPSDMSAIAREIPLKTHQDISIMINRYMNLAHKQDAKIYNEEAPIDKWTNIVNQSSEYNDLCPIARAFKYIKYFGVHNQAHGDDAENAKNINDCYDLLAKLSKGVTPRALNPRIQKFLNDILKETAKEVKKDKSNKKMELFLKNLRPDVIKHEKKTYGKRKLQVLDDVVINPLKFPKDLLLKSQVVLENEQS